MWGLEGYLPAIWGGGGPPTLARVDTPNSGGQSSTASTCYAAGVTYLAFTQEDFLVVKISFTHQREASS